MKTRLNSDNAEFKDSIDKLNNLTKYGNAFHTYEMYEFYNTVKNYNPIFLGLFDDSDELLSTIHAVIQREPGFVKKKFTKRAIIFSGPVFDDNKHKSEKYLDRLLSSLNEILDNKAIYTEFRNFNNYSDYKSIFEEHGFSYNKHLNFHISCKSRDKMMERMSSSRERNIRDSFQNGANIRSSNNTKEVEEFYKILENLYEQKIKKPLPSLDYFLEFYKRDIGKYFMVTYKGNIIGGIMCPILDNKVMYEAYIAGKYDEFDDIHPTVLATYAAMDYANNNDIDRFDLMGAGKPDEDYGVREFKRRFGGELVEHGRFKKINKPLLYKIGKLGLKVKQSV